MAQKIEAETAIESRCSRLEVRAAWSYHLGKARDIRNSTTVLGA